MALDPRPAVSIPNSDHLLLESIAEEAASDRHPIASYLLGELRRAAILPDHELPAGTVTLNRWVTYRIDQGWPLESRVLVCPGDYRSPSLHLSVLSPLGASLLGLRVGSRIRYRSIEGVPHVASVESLGSPSGTVAFSPRPGRRAAPDDDDTPFDPPPAAA